MSSMRSHRGEGGGEGSSRGGAGSGAKLTLFRGGFGLALMFPPPAASAATGEGDWARLDLCAEGAAASYSSPSSATFGRFAGFSFSLPLPLLFSLPLPFLPFSPPLLGLPFFKSSAGERTDVLCTTS